MSAAEYLRSVGLLRDSGEIVFEQPVNESDGSVRQVVVRVDGQWWLSVFGPTVEGALASGKSVTDALLQGTYTLNGRSVTAGEMGWGSLLEHLRPVLG